MAKKKENKGIGYIILSFIPLFGIVWAAVAGIQHNGYVKEAKEAEIKFEQKFVQKINDMTILKDANISFESLNITSALAKNYATKLSSDKVSTNNSSYTITLGANPIFNTVDGKNVFDGFELRYEFFVTFEKYSELLENYQDNYITVVGEKEYLFETYYPNNPKSSPIYALETIFDEYCSNILLFEVNGDALIGVSASSIVDLIDGLPTDIEPTKTDVDLLTKKIKEIETEMALLGENQLEEIDNMDKLNQAKSLLNSRSVEYRIDLIDSIENYALSTNKKITDSRDAYNKLTDEEKANVGNLEELEFAEFEYPMWKVTYYVLKGADASNAATNAAKFYAELTLEQRNEYKADGLYEALLTMINKYNETASDKDKISLVD